MSKLMDELIAEMNRVNNLETEVNKTVNQLSNESGLARQEKLKEICQFLLRMTDLLLQAKVIKPANSSSCRYYSAIVNTGIRFQRKTVSARIKRSNTDLERQAVWLLDGLYGMPCGSVVAGNV